LPHSNPYGVILYAVRLQLPGAKLSVTIAAVSPSQDSLFNNNLEWSVQSYGLNYIFSFYWVCIQPNGSKFLQ